jgi:hypothetical protein
MIVAQYMRRGAAVLLVGAVAACDAAEGVHVQPLPPLDRPSPEARHGLPEVEGVWGHAGWEFPDAQVAEVFDTLARPGDLVFHVQRLDSVAGEYREGAARMQAIGEVRRDRTLALVIAEPEGARRYLTGIVSGDTLWVELTSLEVSEAWPAGTRSAWLRGQRPSLPFFQLPGGVLLRDTLEIDTLAALPDTVPPADTLPPLPEAAPQPVPQPPAAAPAPRPETPRPPQPEPRPEPRPQPPPAEPRPQPQPPAEPPPPAEPRPQPQPRDTIRFDPPPPPAPAPVPAPPPPPPRPMPRDTIVIPTPPDPR